MQILWFEGFEAWQWAKFETELDIREKIKWISGGQVIGSRIQVNVNAVLTACTANALTALSEASQTGAIQTDVESCSC